MEQEESHSFPETHEISDLNVCDSIEGENCHQKKVSESSLANEVTFTPESYNMDVEGMENRLAIGQVVENEHIAYALYCKYASAKGFSVRKGKNVMFKDGCGLIKGKFFYCSCEGTKDRKRSQNKVPDYQKTDFRCNCMARLKVSRKKGGLWRVSVFHKEHNHELYAPNEAYLLTSNRNLTEEQELLLSSMTNCGIPVSLAVGFLESMAQGKENVGFTAKDAYNCLARSNRKTRLENGDSSESIKHFIDKSNKESGFYWNVDVDDNKRVMNLFFRDHRCRVDYEKFGDVLSFDTTYRTNKYELICAPFIGINHHNENVMFGIAFLSDETTESFQWLFKVFLESMGGKQPKTIFTDQCQAMANAIKTEFPNAQHRLCQWHINQNAPSHFGSLNNDSKFQYLWSKCMKYCDSEEEFESTWKNMMENYDICERNWFNTMYELRDKWATAFSANIFSAGLFTTSRSEGTNSALKHQVGNKKSTLYDCIVGYEKLQENWRTKEREKDILCHHKKPSLFAPFNPLLKHAAEVYTLEIFKLFEKELKDTMDFEQPLPFAYDGSSIVWYKVKAYGSSWFKTVGYDSQRLEVKCSCHKFETAGILCSHALKVLLTINMQLIPENYIKWRWTKAAKCGISSIQGASSSENNCSGGENNYVAEMAFVNHATKRVHDLAMRGKAHPENRGVLTKYIEGAEGELNAWFANMNLNNSSTGDVLATNKVNIPNDDVLVRDPLIVKSRGITNVLRRHWDAKKKKTKGETENGKGKVENVKGKTQNGEEKVENVKGKTQNGKRKADESSETTGNGSKRRRQSSQATEDDCILREITNLPPVQYQMPYVEEYAENPSSYNNLDLPQDFLAFPEDYPIETIERQASFFSN